jgi:hypothetical protein
VSRFLPRPAIGAAACVAALLVPEAARADVSSFMAIGGGYTGQFLRQPSGSGSGFSSDWVPAIDYSIGVGSSPLASAVAGGMIRGATFVGLGTDLGIAARVCTGGFARGDWGAAFDLGVSWRSWQESTYGEWPVQAVLTGGTPWGFQLALGAEVSSVPGGQPADGFFAAIEIDLLRLTVMRQGSSEPWWYNPAPAGGHMAKE